MLLHYLVKDETPKMHVNTTSASNVNYRIVFHIFVVSVFTARRSYASAVLRVVILSITRVLSD